MSPLELLLQIQSQDASGLLFVVTSEGRQIRIGIDAGRIAQIGYGRHRGRAALELAATAVAQSATFRSDLATSWDTDLPNERAVLGQLSRMLSGLPSERPAAVAAAGDGPDYETLERTSTVTPPSTWTTGVPGDTRPGSPQTVPPVSVEPAPRVWSTLTPGQIDRVKRLLVEYVGPVADFLVEERVRAGVLNAGALVDAVAQEIDNPRDAQAFQLAAERMGLVS